MKTDLLVPSSAPSTPQTLTATTTGAVAGSSVSAVSGDGAGDKGVNGGDLEDVNWSDDEALDALVDKVVGEVDGKRQDRVVCYVRFGTVWFGVAQRSRSGGRCTACCCVVARCLLFVGLTIEPLLCYNAYQYYCIVYVFAVHVTAIVLEQGARAVSYALLRLRRAGSPTRASGGTYQEAIVPLRISILAVG